MITNRDRLHIVLQGIEGKVSVTELCSNYHILQSDYERWKQLLLERGADVFDAKDQSKSSDGKISDKNRMDQTERYNAALAAARYEGGLLWQIFSVFLLIHTVNVGFIFQGVSAPPEASLNYRIEVACILGLLLCLLWTATYLRNSAHYKFYLARARETEPLEWNLYGGSGRIFSEGGTVEVGSQRHKLPAIANYVRSGRMIPPVIVVFIVVYVLALVCAP